MRSKHRIHRWWGRCPAILRISCTWQPAFHPTWAKVSCSRAKNIGTPSCLVDCLHFRNYHPTKFLTSPINNYKTRWAGKRSHTKDQAASSMTARSRLLKQKWTMSTWTRSMTTFMNSKGITHFRAKCPSNYPSVSNRLQSKWINQQNPRSNDGSSILCQPLLRSHPLKSQRTPASNPWRGPANSTNWTTPWETQLSFILWKNSWRSSRPFKLSGT